MNQQPVNLNHDEFQDLLVLGPECRERFLITEEVPEMQDYDLHLGGVSVLQGRYQVGQKTPDLHTLLFTTAGRGRLSLPGRQLAIPPGSVTLLPAGRPFLFELDGDDWHMAWLLLRDSGTWARLREHDSDVFQHDQVWALAPLMDSLYHQSRTPRRRPLLTLVHELLTEILSQQGGFSRLEMAVRQLFARLEAQLHQKWSQAALAEAVHCSVPHLNRVCRKLYGQSPMHRLARLRLQRARELLAHSNWQISQVAQRVGYPDAFNFSHWFRHQTGVSPSHYRAQARAHEPVRR